MVPRAGYAEVAPRRWERPQNRQPSAIKRQDNARALTRAHCDFFFAAGPPLFLSPFFAPLPHLNPSDPHTAPPLGAATSTGLDGSTGLIGGLAGGSSAYRGRGALMLEEHRRGEHENSGTGEEGRELRRGAHLLGVSRPRGE